MNMVALFGFVTGVLKRCFFVSELPERTFGKPGRRRRGAVEVRLRYRKRPGVWSGMVRVLCELLLCVRGSEDALSAGGNYAFSRKK